MRSACAAILALILSSACGQAFTPDDQGDPLFVLHGRMSGTELGEAQGRYRAALVIAAVEESPLVECARRFDGGLEAFQCLSQPLAATVMIDHAELITKFPTDFEVPIYRVGDLRHEPGTPLLAFGAVGIYDDINENGALDATAAGAQPLDSIVAVSLLTADRAAGSFLMLRHGPLHPMWRLLRELLGCPDPPEGFSVLRFEIGTSVTCAVSPSEAMIVEAAIPWHQYLLCHPLATISAFDYRFVYAPSPHRPPEAVPEDNAHFCSGDGAQLFLFDDEGNFCDAAGGRTIALRGEDGAGKWDLSDALPVWWPCELR